MKTGHLGIRTLSVILMIIGFIVVIIGIVHVGFAIGTHKILCMPVQGCIETEIGIFYTLLSIMLPGLLIVGGLGLLLEKSWGWWSLAIYAFFWVFYRVFDFIVASVTRGVYINTDMFIQTFLCFLLLVYLFREKVLSYASIFGKKKSNLLVLLWISVIILMLFELSV